jgi:type IV pilus assembly protein PilV
MLLMKSRPLLASRRRASRARGFSLIEVLVSMFIVSLGILALGGLLQSASRYGKMSEVRSMATLLANDIADRIHANAGAGKDDYKIGSGGFPTDVSAPASDCISPGCTVPQLAQRDMYIWTQRLKSMLPDGSAYIEFKAGGTPNGSFDVWVAWRDPATSKTGSTERPDAECPANWAGASDDKSVRCVFVQVGR